MNILLHALGARLGGAMRHLTNFLPELAKQDRENRYVVFVNDSFPSQDLTENIEIERFLPKMTNGWLKRLYLDNIVIPRHIKRERFDLLITLTNFGPIKSPCPQILFQRNPIYFCQYYTGRIRGILKAETCLRRRLAVEAMKRADLIVTPSHAMKHMIRKIYPALDENRFYTLYHAYSHDNLHSEPLIPVVRNALERSGMKLLYPTHPAPHKGFDVLFRILALLKKQGIPVTLFLTTSRAVWPEGIKTYERLIRQLAIEEQVVFLGPISQTQIGELYQVCELMVYPSLCESFGFSMLEALGHGLPIVAADTEINREICQNSALYYSPQNDLDGARVLLSAFDVTTRQSLVEAGRKRFVSFDWSWQRYVQDFLKMVKSIL